jgi:hypothetical protein
VLLLAAGTGSGENDGQIWKDSTSEGQESDGRTEERHPEKRKVREEGHEPKTGNCHWAFGGASRGRKGAQKESLFQEKSVVGKENYFEEKACRPEKDFVQLMTTPGWLRDSSGNQEN